MAKKIIYFLSIIGLYFLSKEAAFFQIATLGLFELIDINENTKTK